MHPIHGLTGVVLATALACGAGAPRDETLPAVTWEEDLDKARALSRKSGKPLFVTIRCER
jgi:hypothetical protein